jgi:hypothetical protein
VDTLVGIQVINEARWGRGDVGVVWGCYRGDWGRG